MSIRRRSASIAGFLFCLCAGALAAPTLSELAQRHQVCAVSVARLHQGQLQRIEHASGCELGRSLPDEPVYQAASLSKTVFAYLVLKLADELGPERFDLDAPLSRYLPQGYWHQRSPARSEPATADLVPASALQALTARQLLQHGSGLPNWSAEALKPEQPAGAWHYSGEGYVLLQAAIEAITGEPLDVLARRRVFDPLQMAHTEFRWNAQRLQADFIDGSAGNGRPMHVRSLLQPRAAFTLYTSAADYARLLAALLAAPPLLQRIQERPLMVDPDLGLRWGLGFGLAAGRDGREPLLWHWGNNPGYRSFVIVSPTSGDAMVLLSSGEQGLELAAPLAEPQFGAPLPLFRFYMLRSGASHWLCKNLGWCH